MKFIWNVYLTVHMTPLQTSVVNAAQENTNVRESSLISEVAGSSDGQYTSTYYTASNSRWNTIFTTTAKKTPNLTKT